MLPAELVAHLHQFGAGEFQQLVALGAMEMIVLRIAVIVLIDRPAVEREAAEQSGIDKFVERSIDGRPADVVGVARRGQLFHQLVGVKVFVAGKDMIDQGQPLLRDAHPFALQEFDKSVAGRKSNWDAFEGLLVRHGIGLRLLANRVKGVRIETAG